MSVFFDHDRDIVVYDYHKKHKYYMTSYTYRQLKGTGLPANSTDIPLPEKPAPVGMIYVFTGSQWVLEENNFARPNIKKETYTYKGIKKNIELETIPNPHIYFPQYNNIDDYISSQLKTLNLSFTFSRIQRKYRDLLENYNSIAESKKLFNIQEIVFNYRMESESFVAMIRSFFDEMVQLTYLLVNDSVEKLIDSIGDLKRKANDNKICYDIFFGNGKAYENDESNYLTLINDLSNSIKHSSLHYECYSLIPCIPNVISIYKKQNNFKSNEVIFHDHSIYDLILAFKDNFHRIIKNQHTYIKGKTNV